MLALLIIVPMVGALSVLVMPDQTQKHLDTIKITALATSLLTCAISFVTWALFDTGVVGYQLVQYSDVGFAAIHLGVDGLAVFYVVLTGILTPICLLASWSNVTHGHRLFNFLQLITCALLMGVWVQIDLLLFYVCFEAVLVPLFFVVGMYGGSESRVRSAILLFLYTLAGSLFMLLGIVGLYGHVGTLDFTILHTIQIDSDVQRVLWVFFALALAVKTPVVPLHIWLPRAHADAPLAGSMVLAGTVLKLATYGVLRVILPIMPEATAYYTPLVQTIAVVSLVYSSLATLRQGDFKALVAYSSVAHMAVVLLGLVSNTQIGITGAIILSIAHGFVSPALFMLMGGVLYDRFHSRQLRYYRGLASTMPLFSVLSFLFVCGNMGVPLTLNWVGEFIALAGTYQSSVVAGSLGATGIVLSACYSIWLWGRMNAGSYSPHLGHTIDVTRREAAVLMPLLLFTILLGVKPGIIMDTIAAAVSAVLY